MPYSFRISCAQIAYFFHMSKISNFTVISFLFTNQAFSCACVKCNRVFVVLRIVENSKVFIGFHPELNFGPVNPRHFSASCTCLLKQVFVSNFRFIWPVKSWANSTVSPYTGRVCVFVY